MTVTTILVTGDSLAAGTSNNYSTSQAGTGSWTEQFVEQLSSLTGLPVISPGVQMLAHSVAFLAGGDTQWTKTGTWAKSASTDAWDKAPYGYAYTASAGAGDVLTWNKPPRWRPVIGFAVLYVDHTGNGNWQYRVDGGTYVNNGQTQANSNVVRMFYVPTSVTTSVDFRAYNGAGNAGICMIGIVPYFASPTATSGLIVHNVGCNGNRLSFLAQTTSGDRMATFDTVTLGTGSPLPLTPNAGTLMLHINDVAINNTTTWGNDLTTFYNRVSPLGPVGFLAPWEASTGTWPSANQAAYRAMTATKATALGAQRLDFYDTWGSYGLALNASLVPSAANYLWDGTHQAQLGHDEVTNRVLWWYLTKINTTLTLRGPSYPMVGGMPTVAYSGRPTTIGYMGRIPVNLAS